MEIEPKKERNYIFLASGIDPRLQGFSLDGWKLKTIHKKPLENELQDQTGESLFNALERAEKHPETFMSGYQQVDFVDINIFNYKDIIRDCMKKNNYDEIINKFYVFFEKKTKKEYEIYQIISTLRLFKTSRLGLYYPLSYDGSGKIVSEVVFSYPTSITESSNIENFTLDEQEQIKIQDFYKKVLSQLNNPIIQTMVELFNTSYSVMDNNIGFIIRVTILEMLIEDNKDLSYRLSLYIAILLGKNKKESKEIFENCRDIYNARSNFLHNGEKKKITDELQFWALDYSRRMIANLINITLEIQEREKKKQEEQHKQREKRQKKPKDWLMKTIRSELNPENFGDNPFNVKF